MTLVYPQECQVFTDCGHTNLGRSPEIPSDAAVDFTAAKNPPQVRSIASSFHYTGISHRLLRLHCRTASAPVPAMLLPPELPPDPDILCQYKGKLCRNERTFKDDGERHTLCELHRQRANANQRRWQKKHQHKLRRRRAAAAQVMTRASPNARDPPQTAIDVDENGDEDDDWINPLFDHLIAKLDATSEAQTVPTVCITDNPT